MVQIRGYKINKLEIENNLKNGDQLQLKNQVSYNVNYMDDDKRCVGILNFKMSDENLKPFELKVELVAEFSYAAEDEKSMIHTESFDQVFPFLRQIVHSTCGWAGMNNFMMPIMKLNPNTVQVGKPEPIDEGTNNLN